MVCANRPAGVIIIEIYTTNYLAVFCFFVVVFLLLFLLLFLHKIIIGSSCS